MDNPTRMSGQHSYTIRLYQINVFFGASVQTYDVLHFAVDEHGGVESGQHILDYVVYQIRILNYRLLMVPLLFDAVSQYLEGVGNEFFLLCELHYRCDCYERTAGLDGEQPLNRSFISQHRCQTTNQYFQILRSLDIIQIFAGCRHHIFLYVL